MIIFPFNCDIDFLSIKQINLLKNVLKMEPQQEITFPYLHKKKESLSSNTQPQGPLWSY